MNAEAKRNKYRGLTAFVRKHYDFRTETIESIYAALQLEPRWAGVSSGTVQSCVFRLRREARPIPKAKTSDVLITIPLPKRQSTTMTFSEARELYSQLHNIFKP